MQTILTYSIIATLIVVVLSFLVLAEVIKVTSSEALSSAERPRWPYNVAAFEVFFVSVCVLLVELVLWLVLWIYNLVAWAK